ncbi:hypothetical protein FQR65_LT18232 [Abscondita terminalis]|nr:hypothetical protein FQR65_LT18232 [Abscondita terminalis]
MPQYIFTNNPSYTEIKKCNICFKLSERKSVIVPINVDTIKKLGFYEIAKAILDAIPYNISICCNHIMERTRHYGTQIFIECDLEPEDSQTLPSLGEFATSSLLQVLLRYDGVGERSGHYPPPSPPPRVPPPHPPTPPPSSDDDDDGYIIFYL